MFRKLGHTRTLVLALLVVGAVATANVVFWLRAGPFFDYARTSPDGAYRLEFYTVARYQRFFHEGKSDPGFARLVRVVGPPEVRQSEVVDFFGGRNGEIFWRIETRGKVMVGMDIRFDSVHPISPTGEVLPLPE